MTEFTVCRDARSVSSALDPSNATAFEFSHPLKIFSAFHPILTPNPTLGMSSLGPRHLQDSPSAGWEH